jgi:trans-2,3-dihydro-3-hydroxyanthranilate isomerase
MSEPLVSTGQAQAGPVQVQQTVVFADGDGGGNPCPVVFGADAWPAETMRELAAGYGEETGFVLAASGDADLRLRYFVPRHEMEMCVHATVAAVVVHGRAGGIPEGEVVVETPLGNRRVVWDKLQRSARVELFAPEFAPLVADPSEVLSALGASPEQLAPRLGPVRAVSVARPKLIVPLRDEQALDALRPDFERLWTLCERLGVTGMYPFALNAERADAAARQFPLRAGYDEDAATGVAAGALGAYLARYVAPSGSDGWQRWTIAQGRQLGRPSSMLAEALITDGRPVAARVGGAMRELGEREHRRNG